MYIRLLGMMPFLTLGAWGRSLILLKCCPQQHVFNLTNSTCEEVKTNFVVDWIPDQIKTQALYKSRKFKLLVPTLEEFDLSYGPCPALLEKVETPLVVDRDTSMILKDDPAASVVLEGNAIDQWCVDAAVGHSQRRTWVVLSCPCLHSTCICQCCLDNYRLNINKATAVSFLGICPHPNVTDWRPSVQNLNLPVDALRPWYFRYLTLYEYTRSCLHSVRKDYGKTRRPKLIEDFSIDERGVLKSKKLNANKWSYCVGEAVVGGVARTVAMYCDHSEFVISYEAAGTQSALAAIGAVFSALTLLVHALSADLRKGVKGLSLIAHCAAMLCAYLTLAFRPLAWSSDGDACTVLGTLTHFFLLSSFFWLNVRAIIIHSTFRSLDSMLSGLSTSSRSFPFYALYAIGVPALVSGFMAWAQFANDASLPYWLVWPDIDEASCWFRSPLGRALYFSLPMGVLLVINVVLFVSTLVKINAFKKENHATLNSDKSTRDNLKFDIEKLKLFANLSLLMGLTYLSELFSWFNYLFSFYWFASNVAIALRALLLFVVFCCRTKVWVSLRRQYPLLDRGLLAASGHCSRWWDRVNWRRQYQPQELGSSSTDGLEPTHMVHLETKAQSSHVKI